MDSSEDRSSASESEWSEQLPRDGKLRRVAVQLQGLLDDFRTWIDLRLDLAILKVEERIDKLRNEIALGVTLAISGFLAAIFSLATVAVGVGWLLGHPFWGFLAVSVGLILVVGLLRVTQPSLVPPSNLLQRLRGQRGEGGQDGDGKPDVGREARSPVSPTSPSESAGG